MMRVTIPCRRALQQPLTTCASVATTALSLTMTLTAACQHWPTNLPFGVATALTAELCKLALGCMGIARLHTSQTWRSHAGAAICLSLAAVFHLGSIGASVVCMSQAEGAEHARVLHGSRSYASAQERLKGIDSELAALRSAASSDIAHGFRKRGLATLERATALGIERQAAEINLATLEKHPATATTSTAGLSEVLGLAGASVTPNLFNLLLEIAIGSAIELAGIIFLWWSIAATAPVETKTASSKPQSPPPSPARRRRRDQTPPLASAAPAPMQSALAGTAIPATYARNLRFGTGPSLEKLLHPLEARRCGGTCRDLLHRMGNHCLHESNTNGSIELSEIRQYLRGSRDWRTIESHLALLTQLGALTQEGSTYTIAHFLEANPSAERRAARLAALRSKACKRQRKHRKTQQSLQAQPLQTAGFSALSPPRHAEKPQPTSHASDVSAAHAATHQPTTVAKSHSCNRVEHPAVRTRRSYGVVTESEPDAQYEARLRKLAARHITAAEANKAADDLEEELAAKPVPTAPTSGCIAVKIPPGPPINENSVIEACRLVNLPDNTDLIPALFKQLSLNAVTQPELKYAAWCTKHRRDQGRIRESVVGFMVETIRRQRVASGQAALDPSPA